MMRGDYTICFHCFVDAGYMPFIGITYSISDIYKPLSIRSKMPERYDSTLLGQVIESKVRTSEGSQIRIYELNADSAF